jgi:hypothetical protein
MHFICTPMWTRFYSCKKWVLHYKVWIDTERGEKVKHHLYNMVKLNMMEEFRAHRMEEHRRVDYFVMQHEMDRKEYKEKREEERGRSMRKHDVRMKRMLEVVRKRS